MKEVDSHTYSRKETKDSELTSKPSRVSIMVVMYFSHEAMLRLLSSKAQGSKYF